MGQNLGTDIRVENVGWLDGAGQVAMNDKKDIDTINDVDNVRQALIIRLNCPQRSIIWHPEYGNGIFDILSETMDDNFFTLAVSAIKDCIRQEPRVKLLDVKYEVNHSERTIIYTVYYQIVNKPTIYNLVYTFKKGG